MNQQMNLKKRLSTLPSWRSTVLVAACLLSFTPVAAQQKIDRLMDEIESRGVDVNTVIKRDKKTGKMTFMTRQMTFRSRKGNYAKKLERAFDEESRKAVLVNHSNGRYKLEFEDAEGNTSYYMLTCARTSARGRKKKRRGWLRPASRPPRLSSRLPRSGRRWMPCIGI